MKRNTLGIGPLLGFSPVRRKIPIHWFAIMAWGKPFQELGLFYISFYMDGSPMVTWATSMHTIRGEPEQQALDLIKGQMYASLHET